MTVKIEAKWDRLVVQTPFDRRFVDALKAAIPYWDRNFDRDSKAWVVAPEHGQRVADLVDQYFHRSVDVPAVAATEPEIIILNLRYIGRVKLDTGVAHGYVDGGWNAIFPRKALMEWFGQRERPDDTQTLYEVLGVRQTVAQADLKKAYRRLAKVWHPDVSKEADATEQFQRIQEAYAVLKEAPTRAKYDAGLALEALWESQDIQQDRRQQKLDQLHRNGYQPPLRCGMVMVKGQARPSGKIVVSEILHWGDITNDRGEILASTWEPGSDSFTEVWVAP